MTCDILHILFVHTYGGFRMSVHHGRHWVANDVSLDTATTLPLCMLLLIILIFTLVRKLLWPLRQLLLIRTSEWIEVRYTVSARSTQVSILYPLHVTQKSELSFHEIIERLEPRPNCNQ